MTDLTLEQQQAIAVAQAKRKRAEAEASAPKPWYGDEPGIAAKLLEGGKKLVTGIDDVMSGRVDPKSDQGIANITDAAMVGTPVSAATRGGLGWMGAKATPKTTAATPTSKEILGTGGFGFNLAREMDVRYSIKPIQNMAFNLQSKLNKRGYKDRDVSASETHHELKELLKPTEAGAYASIDDLHDRIISLREITKNPDRPTDAAAARIVIKEIDKFISEPDPSSVMAGPAAAAGGVWKDAMGNWASGKQSERLTGLADDAELQAIATNSGLNQDNKLRQLAALIVRRDDLRAGFSSEQVAKLRDVAGEGAKSRNALRWFAHVLGGGGGLGALVTGLGGAAVTGMGAPAVVGSAVVGAGLGAKILANKITKSKLGKVDEAVRQQSPLYRDRVATAPTVPVASPAARSAPLRGGAAVSAPPPMNREQFEEYLRQKRAFEQGA